MTRSHYIIFALLLGPCTACEGGTETGNPDTARITLAATTSDPSVASTSPGGPGHLIGSLDLSVKSLGLIDCATHAAQSAEVGGVAHLVPGNAAPIAVPPGDYCGVAIDLAGAAGAPSIAVQGTRSDGLPFTIDDASALSVSLTATAAFTLHANEPAIAAFDLALWFGGTFLGGAAPVNGRVTIDASSDPAALTDFEAQAAGALYRDLNDDGHVDHADGPPIAAGHSFQVH
jgi:hypothetical protein